ncbi:MAG TPA: endonuclease/exonuclease/phosphatase family protein [Actinomycetota bacterium]|nr:endonuclease/exonuclease/phosphatase family protein [Actinomycetota bacterium]
MKVLRLATFNIRHGRGLDDHVDLQRTAAAIVETGADLIALQEIDRNQKRSGGEDQVARLEALTGLHIAFWPTVRKGDGEYGIGIGTRAPIDLSDWRFEPLPRLGSEEPRGAIVGLLREHGLSVVATHLSTDKAARKEQILALGRLEADLEPPVTILGDLNQGRVGLRPLTKAGYDAGRRIEHTMTRRSLRWQIDFVLVGPPARLASSETITTEASDHVPLVAEVAIPFDP